MVKQLLTDSYSTDADEGLELMIHHLRLAAMFFEVVTDPIDYVEVQRLLSKHDRGSAAPVFDAGIRFIEILDAKYEAMKADD